MTSVALVEHDRVGEFLRLLESTAGRDRVTRLMQYTAKYLKWQEEINKNRSEEYVEIYSNIYSSMSLVRKVLRFFRSIAVLRAIQAAWPKQNQQWSLELLFNILAKLSLASYFLFDHGMFAARMGLWKPNSQQNKIANYLTEGSWQA
jgi:peroxin-11B